MKALLVLTVIVFAVSCSSPSANEAKEEQPREINEADVFLANLNSYFQENLNDPSSLEIIEVKPIDTVFYYDNIEYRRNSLSADIKEYESDTTSILYNPKMLKKDKALLKLVDSLETVMGEQVNEVASYTYYVKYRAKNGFGALAVFEKLVQTSPPPELKVINFTDERSKLHLNPNDFPHYREKASEILNR